MITITEAAEEKIATLVAASEKPVKGLRIGARLDPAKQVDYKLAFISDQQVGGDDQIVRFEGFDVYIDPESADLLAEAKVDYVDGLMGSGFQDRASAQDARTPERPGGRSRPPRH